jgi:hypothetical protein
MKSYTLPTVLLLMLSVLAVVAILHSFAGASHALSELAAERMTVQNDQTELAATQQAAKAVTQKSVESDHFLDKWTTELQAEASIEDIFGRLDTLAVNNLLSPSGKNFKLNGGYFFNGHHLPVQNVNINVAGDFYRTLNWLGAAENAFPLARVEQITYTNTGNALSMAVEFSFPRKFEATK